MSVPRQICTPTPCQEPCSVQAVCCVEAFPDSLGGKYINGYASICSTGPETPQCMPNSSDCYGASPLRSSPERGGGILICTIYRVLAGRYFTCLFFPRGSRVVPFLSIAGPWQGEHSPSQMCTHMASPRGRWRVATFQ